MFCTRGLLEIQFKKIIFSYSQSADLQMMFLKCLGVAFKSKTIILPLPSCIHLNYGTFSMGRASLHPKEIHILHLQVTAWQTAASRPSSLRKGSLVCYPLIKEEQIVVFLKFCLGRACTFSCVFLTTTLCTYIPYLPMSQH